MNIIVSIVVGVVVIVSVFVFTLVLGLCKAAGKESRRLEEVENV